MAVRLTTKGPHWLGQPIRFVVEAKNVGERTVSFDVQGLSHMPFQMKGPDGRPVDCVDYHAHHGQTFQHFLSLEPGAAFELTAVDATHSFAIFKAGAYTVTFTGLERWGIGPEVFPPGASKGSVVCGVPESAPLRVEIGPGDLRARDQILRRIFPILPEGWTLWDAGAEGAVAIIFHRPDLDRNGRWAGLRLESHGATRAESRSLGTSPFGEIWLSSAFVRRKAERDAEDERLESVLAETVVPALEEKVRRALEIR